MISFFLRFFFFHTKLSTNEIIFIFRRNFIAFDQKPIILLSPDIRVQTELKKLKNPITSDIRKKSIIDSGIELLFKKNSKNIKDGVVQQHHAIDTNYNKHHTEITAGIGGAVEKLGNFYHGDDNSKWNLFDTIKIHTDKKRTSDTKGIIDMR